MEQNLVLKEELIYYFRDMGILIYSEFKINKDNKDNNISYNKMCLKYFNLLNNENIISSLKSKINYKVCYLFYKTKIVENKENEEDEENKENEKNKEKYKNQIKYLLSKFNINLKINYYNFILLCNLIHYYNNFFNYKEIEVLFLLNQLNKFAELIIKNDIYIKDEDDSKILILLFFYYYSILSYNLFKQKKYEHSFNGTAENFYEYIAQISSELFNDNPNSPLLEKYINKYLNINIDNLINYAKKNNEKLSYFIEFFKLLLKLFDYDRKNIINKFDFSFIKYFLDSEQNLGNEKNLKINMNMINKKIILGILFRKLLFGIINYNEEFMHNLEKEWKSLKSYFNDSNNSNINFNNSINNNKISNNNNNENNIDNKNNNEIKEINNKLDYFEKIINSNQNLLLNKLKKDYNIDYKYKVDKIENLPNLIKEFNIYHKYNLKVLLQKKENDKKINNNFLQIIYYHNEIMSLTKEYIKNREEKERNEKKGKIISYGTYFVELLEKIEKKENDINFIKNNNYIKIIITRIFYNYYEIQIISETKGSSYPKDYDVEHQKFEHFINVFEIKNHLINKINGDFHFLLGRYKKAKEEYSKSMNNSDNFNCLATYFSNVISYNIDNPNQNKKIFINNLKKCLVDLKNNYENEEEYLKIRSYLEELQTF